jgi:hypothetical protein
MKMDSANYEALKADIKSVAVALSITPATADGGKTGLKTMWGLFHRVCENRAYDDSHPMWSRVARLLPFDGRAYAWLYNAGLNDDHIATALRAIKAELS